MGKIMWSSPSKFAVDPAAENDVINPYAPGIYNSSFHLLNVYCIKNEGEGHKC